MPPSCIGLAAFTGPIGRFHLMPKAIRTTLLTSLALAWMSVSWAQSGVVNSTKNPNQIAILHWYQANQTTSFGIGSSNSVSNAVASDGVNIWITNVSGGTNPSRAVIKMRASDGALLGTFTFPNEVDPFQMVFDGANIWVTNAGLNSVSKIRASDGQLLGTFAVGKDAEGVTFDGANIWVANTLDATVTKLRASDGAVLGTFPTGQQPEEIAFDGANIWVSNHTDRT